MRKRNIRIKHKGSKCHYRMRNIERKRKEAEYQRWLEHVRKVMYCPLKLAKEAADRMSK